MKPQIDEPEFQITIVAKLQKSVADFRGETVELRGDASLNRSGHHLQRDRPLLETNIDDDECQRRKQEYGGEPQQRAPREAKTDGPFFQIAPFAARRDAAVPARLSAVWPGGHRAARARRTSARYRLDLRLFHPCASPWCAAIASASRLGGTARIDAALFP